jgi:hypothetical protein
VIRDDGGDVVAAEAGALKHIRDAFMAEVHACLQGVRAVVDKGINKIILETDSLMLKQALDNDSYRLAEAGGLIYQLKSLISESFSGYCCTCTPRLCNKVAHALAVEGSLCNHGADVHWDFTPACVEMATGRNPSGSAVPYPHPPTLTPSR